MATALSARLAGGCCERRLRARVWRRKRSKRWGTLGSSGAGDPRQRHRFIDEAVSVRRDRLLCCVQRLVGRMHNRSAGPEGRAGSRPSRPV